MQYGSVTKLFLSFPKQLNVDFQFPRVLSPKVCLLRIIDEIVQGTYVRLLFGFVLLTVRNAIVMAWRSDEWPNFNHWKNIVNVHVPMYKLLYRRRGCPEKFYKVWGLCLSCSSSATHMLEYYIRNQEVHHFSTYIVNY